MELEVEVIGRSLDVFHPEDRNIEKRNAGAKAVQFLVPCWDELVWEIYPLWSSVFHFGKPNAEFFGALKQFKIGRPADGTIEVTKISGQK